MPKPDPERVRKLVRLNAEGVEPSAIQERLGISPQAQRQILARIRKQARVEQALAAARQAKEPRQ